MSAERIAITDSEFSAIDIARRAIREAALADAVSDVCPTCAGRATRFYAAELTGPTPAGNYLHPGLRGRVDGICAAGPIWARIHREARS